MRPKEGRQSQAPTPKGTELIVHFACDSDALSLPSKTLLSCPFLVSAFVCVCDNVVISISACANLRALFLLFILPVMF